MKVGEDVMRALESVLNDAYEDLVRVALNRDVPIERVCRLAAYVFLGNGIKILFIDALEGHRDLDASKEKLLSDVKDLWDRYAASTHGSSPRIKKGNLQ